MDIFNIIYEKYRLDNGLEVILHKKKTLPIAVVNLWYRVGSAYEKIGKTGLAHFFEHMMFQGSAHVPKEMHFRFVQEAGGTLNGSTSFDRTNYYEKVPSNFLEMVLWLEADRMGFLLPALTEEKLRNQINVVRNERLERYDNQPYGLAWEIIIGNLFSKDHPYGWPTIGFLDDIENYSMDDVSEFFSRYYSPSNASMVISGNYDDKTIKLLVDKYFSEIKGTDTSLLNKIIPKKLTAEKYIERKEKVKLERIYLAWKTEKAFSSSDAALDVVGDIIAGSRSSRLYKKLVFEQELAQDISAYQYSGKLDGFFMIIATVRPGIQPDIVKAHILSEIKSIAVQGVNDVELLRTRNGIKAGFIYSLQNSESLADQLNYYNMHVGEPNYFSEDMKRYAQLTPEIIAENVRDYLTKPFIELRIIPGDDK